MKDAIVALSRSRKAVAALAGIIAAVVLLATQQIDADTAVQMITGLIVVLIGSIAWEDAAGKQGGGATVTLPFTTATGTTSTQATITTTTEAAENTAVTIAGERPVS